MDAVFVPTQFYLRKIPKIRLVFLLTTIDDLFMIFVFFGNRTVVKTIIKKEDELKIFECRKTINNPI